jgi:predicted dienelactone hydrolase
VGFGGSNSQTIAGSQSITVTALVFNDPSGRGVTWTLNGVGKLTNASSASVEYGAPASVPANTTATLTATSIADATKSAVYTVTVAAIAVSVSPSSANVALNVTQTFSATVLYDVNNKGVQWSLIQGGIPCSPLCGSVAPMNTPSSGSTTYTPPPSLPANASVTLTAISVTDTSQSASAALTIAPALPISVTVSPGSDSITAGTGDGFTATVLNDASNSGVTWSLTQSGAACSPGCGTVSPIGTASGEVMTYTAPSTVPTNPAVTLTATSVADATRSGSATLTITPPPISVSVDPKSVRLGITSTQQFVATVKSDSENKGVTWVLTDSVSLSACSPACGTIAPRSTASGEPTTYTAPSAPVSDKVVLTASSVSDPTKSNCPGPTSSGCVSIIVTNGTVKLIPASVAFGRVLIGTTAQLPISLTNTGSAALDLAGFTITGKEASTFSQTNTCGAKLVAGGACTITASFKPVDTQMLSDDLTVTDSSADSPQQLPLTGKGTRTATAAMRAALSASPVAIVPFPTGQSRVGTRVMNLVDSSRPDPYVKNGTKREFLVRFWYPASLDQVCEPAEYTSPRVWKYFSELIAEHLPEVGTNSCLDAPVAEGPHPIVVFSHGYTGTFTDYTFLFEDLASRGYIVASVDHTYEATVVEFPDGRVVESIPGSHFGNVERNDEQELAFAVDVRLGDLKFLADQLERLNSTKGNPFAGRLDTGRVAIAGHSLGGLTAFLGLEQDPRFGAAVILDSIVPRDLASATEKPVLILASDHNVWSSTEQFLWQELHGPRFLVHLRGADHLAFTDLVWLAEGAVRTGTMEPKQCIAAIRDYVAEFLDVNLRRQPPGPLLNGAYRPLTDVELAGPLQSLPGKK